MFAFCEFNKQHKPPEVDEDSYSLTSTLLQFTRKKHHPRLLESQAFKSVDIEENNIKYRIDFELSLEDTVKSPCYLNLENFDSLPENKLLIWICSVRAPKHNEHSRLSSIFEADFSNIKWDFVEMESELELTSKHKGLISLLHNDDFIIAAGEIYIDKDSKIVYWNNQTGCIMKTMYKNGKRIFLDNHTVEEWKIFKRKNGKQLQFECLFLNEILTPIMKYTADDYEIVFDWSLKRKYAPEINDEYVQKICSEELDLKFTKTKI